MPNRLACETSPYLLQHQNNSVDWFPWEPEALERSKTEQQPILLSIGYSACHWCHGMEHEASVLSVGCCGDSAWHRSGLSFNSCRLHWDQLAD